MFEARKIRAAIILLLGVGSIFLILYYQRLTPAPKPEQESAVISAQTTIIDKVSLENKQLPTSLPVFSLQKQTEVARVEEAKRLAQGAGIADNFETFVPPPPGTPSTGPLYDGPFQASNYLRVEKKDGKTIYRWDDGVKTFTYNISSGTFEYKDPVARSSVPNEKDAKEKALEYLKTNALLPENYTITVAIPYVYVQPKVESYDVFSDTDTTYPIVFSVNSDLSFGTIDYRYHEPKETGKDVSLVSTKEIINTIKSKRIQPTTILPENKDFPLQQGTILSEVMLTDIEIKYSQSQNQEQLQPVYVVSGTYKDNNGRLGKAIYAVSAIKN